MKQDTSSIAIIGPGRLGQALARLLVEEDYPVRFIAARRMAAARRAVCFIGGGKAVALDAKELAEASIILLTTSDASLGSVSHQLAKLRRDWSGRIVLHTCGSVPATVLSALKRRGAAIGSWHPFQTIPNPAAGVRNLRGGFWGIEGDPEACRLARRWTKALGGFAFPIRPGKKILYHASAFLVCPTLVTLMDLSAQFLKTAGVPDKIARPMLGRFVAETVRNFVELGGRGALTGPASRGDWGIIRRHVAALKRDFPRVVPLYHVLLQAMLRLAGKNRPPGLA